MLLKKEYQLLLVLGGNCTKNVVELSMYAESVGVDAILLVTPYYNKTTQARFN